MLFVVSIGVVLLSVVMLSGVLLGVSLLGVVVSFVGGSAVSFCTFSLIGVLAEGVRKFPKARSQESWPRNRLHPVLTGGVEAG